MSSTWLVIRRRYVVLSLLGLTAGCGGVHLGPGVGDRYKSAFAAQASRDGVELAPLDADDAKRTMDKRHRGKDAASPAAMPAGGDLLGGGGTYVSGGGSGAGIGSDNNPNPIRLEAR